MTPRPLILASGSPRRAELMTRMGLSFRIVPSDVPEPLDSAKPAAEVAMRLGLEKARAVAAQYPTALVVASDTIVTLNGTHLGKPESAAQARQWLRKHAGGEGIVTTSIVLMCAESGLQEAQYDTATIHFKPLDKQAIETYLATGDWADKAGGWGIQSGAAPLIASLEGRYDTVLGLPTHLLAEVLRAQGVAVKPLILTPPVPQKTSPAK